METSRIGLGTWSIGGAGWGGSDEQSGLATIRAALDRGINVIDTAPVYGLGRAEEIVGRAVKEVGYREKVIISTKVGLEWDDKGGIFRNSSRARVLKEIDDSLRRLQTDYVDIYFVHWPDPETSCEETAEAMNDLFRVHKIRAIGVSNFTAKQMDVFREVAPLAICQPPYNLFERAFEDTLRAYCVTQNIATMTYGTNCRGLLSGTVTLDQTYPSDDLRSTDPKFNSSRREQYLSAAAQLDDYVRRRYGRRLMQLAVRFVLDRGADIALWGARRPEQLDPLDGIEGLILRDEDFAHIDQVLMQTISDPVGPEFMAPPNRTQYLTGKP